MEEHVILSKETYDGLMICRHAKIRPGESVTHDLEKLSATNCKGCGVGFDGDEVGLSGFCDKCWVKI